MVRSETFSVHQYIGDPVDHVRRLVEWDVDELIVLDIGNGAMSFEHHRQDYRNEPVRTLQDFIRRIAVECRIPLTFGGRIRSCDDIRERIYNGADKVSVNAMLELAPEAVREACKRFGSQAIVASVDFRRSGKAAHACAGHGQRSLGVTVVDWCKRAEQLGAGEVLLNAIERDGTAQGFDVDVAAQVAQSVSVPVIICGGAGHERHFAACLDETPVSAVAAGNIFHFTENAYPRIKAYLAARRDDVRPISRSKRTAPNGRRVRR